MADVESFYKNAQTKMDGALSHLDDAFAHIRAGKANVRILEPIHLDYYGSMTPLSGVANITTPDARTIAIQPWEKKMLPAIEKAILASEIGKQLVKQVKAEAENAKVAVRNARRDAIDGLKKEIKNGLAEDAEKDAEDKVQKLHDKYIKMVDDAFAVKEKEIMTV